MRGYGEDLAAIHDAGWLGVAEAGARMLVEALRRRRIDRGLVVELGCGSGASSRILTDAGYGVLGIDASPAMIALARIRAPRAELQIGSFLDASLPPCVAVTAFGETLNYAFDERNSAVALRELCRRVADALAPGGTFLFDVAGPGRGSGRTWTASEGWAVLVEATEADASLTRDIVTFRRVDGAWRRAEETHHQILLAPGEVTTMLRDAGFSVRALRSYGSLALVPHVRAFSARTSGRGSARLRA